MKREHKKNVDNNLVFYAPLTYGSLDIIGGKTSPVDAVSYDENGAYFHTSTKNNYIGYNFNESLYRSIKTVYCEFKRTTTKYNTGCLYTLTGLRYDAFQYKYDIEVHTRHYRSCWHNLDCLSFKVNSNATPPLSTVEGVSNTQITTNVCHKCISGVYHDKVITVLDGVKTYQYNYQQDTFDNYEMIDEEKTRLYFFIGGRSFNSEKMFEGYIRNVKCYTTEFSDEDLINMTL